MSSYLHSNTETPIESMESMESMESVESMESISHHLTQTQVIKIVDGSEKFITMDRTYPNDSDSLVETKSISHQCSKSHPHNLGIDLGASTTSIGLELNVKNIT